MRLVVGLGNPGRQYEGTRHNVGFAALDVLASEAGIAVRSGRLLSLIGRGRIGRENVLLAKPQTYMNLSGRAVRGITDYFRLSVEELIVLHDEMDIEPGRLKVASGGGPGGHKGVASIIASLKTPDFARIKIGIGRPGPGSPADDYVLKSFTNQEQTIMTGVLAGAAEAVMVWLTHGLAEAQTKYNRKDLNLLKE